VAISTISSSCRTGRSESSLRTSPARVCRNRQPDGVLADAPILTGSFAGELALADLFLDGVHRLDLLQGRAGDIRWSEVRIGSELLPPAAADGARGVRLMETRSENEDEKLSTEPGQLQHAFETTIAHELRCRSADLEVPRPRPQREIGSLYVSCADEMLNLANHQKHICWLLKNAVGNRPHFFDIRRRNTGKHDRGGLES
jgi:hypothetical protein